MPHHAQLSPVLRNCLIHSHVLVTGESLGSGALVTLALQVLVILTAPAELQWGSFILSQRFHDC